jgi:hypothetical protein
MISVRVIPPDYGVPWDNRGGLAIAGTERDAGEKT